MIESTYIDGKPALVAYLTRDLEPADADAAELVKVLFKDGRSMWLVPQADEPAEDAEFKEEQHKRDHGKFSSTGGGGKAEAKPLSKPGEAPIPEGKVRRFHYTSPEAVPSIHEKGIQSAYSTGVANQEPVAVWSTPDFPGYGKPVVEFWDDPAHYERHPYARMGDVPPEQIVATHESWHEHARYIDEDPQLKADTLAGKHDNLLNDTDYGPAIKYIKEHGKPATDKEWDESKVNRGQPENAGEFAKQGEGTTSTEPGKPEAEAKPVKAARPKKQPPPTLPAQVFVSPNTGDLTFHGAAHEMEGKRQAAFREVSDAVDTRLGLSAKKGIDAVAVTADGAENTVMTTYAASADPALIRVAAAIKASVANHKSALVFTPDRNGPHVMANFAMKGDLSQIHDKLLEQGLRDHMLAPTKDGARVYVMAKDQDAVAAIDKVAAAEGAEVKHGHGNGEFIGSDIEGTDEEQRADAQRVFADIIQKAGGAGPLGGRPIDVWGDASSHWRSETEGAPLVGSQGHAGLISSRRPHAAGSLEGDRYRQIGLAAEKENPELFEAHTDLFKDRVNYPNLRALETQGKSPDQIAEAFKAHVKANLRFLYHAAPQEMRERAHQWYEGAHGLAAAAAKKYNLPVTSTAGVYAALSPQKLWDMNVYLGDAVIDIYQTKQDHKWDDKMSETTSRIWTPKKPPTTKQAIANAERKAHIVGLMRGQSLADLDKLPEPDRITAQAMWIRTYDEAHSDRHFNRLAPDGESMGLYRKKKTPKQAKAGQQGDPAKAAWQSTPAIINALRSLESSGKRNIISEAMGAQHKVRSFYNNILDPHSKNEDVTMDTHAIGAALLRPLSGADFPVMHSLATSPATGEKAREIGYKKPREDSQLGINGTYAIYADAYRELAHELSAELKRKIEPRELQSVTWEAKRSMFDSTTTDKQLRDTQSAWSDYHNGYISLASTQKRILEIAGGFKKLEDIHDAGD